MVPIEFLWIAIPAASAVLYTLLFFARRHDLGPLENWFAYFLAAGIVWSIGSVLLHANPGFVAPIWFVRLEALGTITMPWALFWFTADFLSLPIRRHKAWLVGSALFYAVTFIANMTNAVMSDVRVAHGLVSTHFEWGVGLTALFWFGHFLPAAFLLIREERRTQDRMFRNRVRYLLLVMALLLVGNVTNATSLGAYPVDLFLASIAALLISLSVSRYQVLEMGHVLRRLLALILVISVYVIVVSGTLYVLASLTNELLLPASVLAALGLAGLLMLYTPFREWVDSFVERVFLPERYSVQALIYAISQAGNRLRLPGELGDDLLRALTKAFQVTQAHLFIRHESGPIYHRIAGSTTERSAADITFQIDSPLMRELAQYRLAMHVDRLQELPRLRALWIGEWDALRTLHAEMLVPVLVADDLIGFLILGKKAGGEPYTRQELQQTLPLLSNQISIALSNSQLYAQEQRRANQLAQANMTLRQAQAALNESAESIRREAARGEALVRIADRLNARLDLAAVLSAVCEETARALEAPAASVALYQEKTDALEYAAGHGLPPAYHARQRATPRAVYDRYARGNGAVVIDAGTLAAHELLDAELSARLNVHTCVATSMTREGRLVGSLNIYALGTPRRFNDDELDLLKGIAAQAAQAIVNARLYDDAQRRLRHVEALRHVDASITGSVDLYQTLRVILDTVKSQLGVDAADVMLLDEQDHVLEYAEGCGFRQPPLRRLVVEEDRECAAEVVRMRQMVVVPNLDENPLWECRTPFPGENFTAYVGMLLIIKDEVKGVLEIFQRGPLEMGNEWLSFLNALCAQAAIAIDNSDLFTNLQYSNQELSQAYESTLEGWARALELRDHETQGHTRRVASMSARLARAIGVAEEDIVHIRRGAILHDIGKMAIPDSILLKPGPLTEEEWRIMRLHPVHAYRMLSSITFLRRALDIPYSHHEKWDGSGYPLGLKGEDIPLWARIFAIVDVWDALLSDRPYHRAWNEPDVRAYLIEQSGRHFDPHIVTAFLAILDGERTPVC